MTTYSETDLATAALRTMGVIEAQESPSTEDSAFAVNAYELKYEELAAPGLEYTYWPKGEIPGAIFLVLRDLLINEIRGAFGDVVPVADKETSEIILLKRLRRHVASKATGLPVRAQYF